MTLRLLFLSLLSINAGEHTIERGDIIKTATLEVKVLPETSSVIQLSPKEWKDFTILSAVSHGDKVSVGAPLITFEQDEIKEKISDVKKDITLKALELEVLKQDITDTEALTPLALESLERDYKRSLKDHTYYVENEFPRRKETYDKFLESVAWDHKNAQEELTQLKAMYEEDDLTEETEEIILQRAEYMANLSQWRLGMAKEEFGRMANVSLPRNLEDRSHRRETDVYAYEEQKRALPLDLKKKKLELSSKEIELSRLENTLTKLEHDVTLMTVSAPITGTFFYGVIKDGGWNGASNTEKFMRKGGKAPTHKTFSCIIPDGSPILAYAQVEAKNIGALKPSLKGTLVMHKNEEQQYPVTCQTLGTFPLPNGKFLASLSLPSGTSLPITLGGTSTLLIAEKKDCLRIPIKALTTRPDGTLQALRFPAKPSPTNSTPLPLSPSEEQAEIKPITTPPKVEKKAPKTEGKPKAEKVLIEVGLFGDEYVEVLGGLKEGDAIKTP